MIHRLSGCDYLGLSREPCVIEAAQAAAARYGVSASASRATTGTTELHTNLERKLSEWLGCEDVAVLADGALANRCAAEALDAGSADFGDRCHPTLRAAIAHGSATCFVSDTVEPIDAWELDPRRLPATGAMILDDCHGIGVMNGGRGVLAQLSPDAASRTLVTGTLAKALGSAGGLIAGPRRVIDLVRQTNTYVCTTALSPMHVAGSLAALDVLQANPERLESLHERSNAVAEAIGCRSRPIPVFGITGDLLAFQSALGEAFSVPISSYPGGTDQAHIRMVVSMSLPVVRFGDLLNRLRNARGDWSILDCREPAVS